MRSVVCPECANVIAFQVAERKIYGRVHGTRVMQANGRQSFEFIALGEGLPLRILGLLPLSRASLHGPVRSVSTTKPAHLSLPPHLKSKTLRRNSSKR